MDQKLNAIYQNIAVNKHAEVVAFLLWPPGEQILPTGNILSVCLRENNIF